MNRLVPYFLFFFLILLSTSLVFAQEEITIKGHTKNEDGKIIGNVRVTVDGKSVTSTGFGAFQVYLKKGTAPQTITASKQGLVIKNWDYDAQNHHINIVMQAKHNLLRGEVRNKYNDHVEGVYVAIQGINEGKASKTNFDGKFAIVLPDAYKATSETPFIIDGLPVDSKEISFKDNNTYVILRKPKAVKEKTVADDNAEEIDNTNLNLVKMKDKTQKNTTPSNLDGNIKDDFKKLNKDLENQRLMIAESNAKVKEDLSRISERIKTNIGTVNKANIKEAVVSLESQLSANNKVYEESQQRTNEIIEKLKMQLSEKDSLNTVAQEEIEKVTEEKKQVEERFHRDILIASCVILFLFILALIFYFIGKRIQKQNKQISNQATELSHAYQEIKAQNKTLAAQKTTLEYQNDALEKQKIIIEKKNSNITASINYAQRIQRAMLPRQEDIQRYLSDSFLLFQPKEIVSGDFYWIAEQEDEYGAKKTIIAAIDCTGHGVPGAFMSMVGDGLLSQIVKLQGITSPNLILKELDKGIRDTLNQNETENKDGMDIAICVIDKYNKQMEFAGAKNPLVYIQNGELHEITGDKLHIGGQTRREQLQDKNFTKHVIDTHTPTTCYIFSDGYEDQFGGAENKKLGKRQLHKFLLENHKEPLYNQKWLLEKNFTDWSGTHTQIDDILVIGFQI